MASNVVSVSIDESTMNRIMGFYREYEIEPSNEFILFAAKNEDVMVTIYKKGKNGCRYCVFQGNKAEYEASIFVPVISETMKKEIHRKETYRFFDQIGSDEVGTGDYFGPIIVCAAFVDAKGNARLNELGITDSKKMSDQYLLEIGPTLIETFDYSLLRVDNETYNTQQQRGYNMNKMKAVLHNRVLLNMAARHPGIALCQDQFAEPPLYYSYLSKEKEVAREIQFSTKGETAFPSVALASCIARFHFLKKMEEMSLELGAPIPLGAGSEVDAFAKKLYEQIGEEGMKKYVKWNFANTKKLAE